jgi:hypothetical protein
VYWIATSDARIGVDFEPYLMQKKLKQKILKIFRKNEKALRKLKKSGNNII